MWGAEAVCWGVRDRASERSERGWVKAHAALTRLSRERAAADAEEGRCLLVAWRAGVHVHLGYGSFSEYVERLLGYSPRATREKLRVAEALERLPLSARALEQGELSWCAARELTRVAVAETEPTWLEASRGKTTRELEHLVAGKRPGELPPHPGEPRPPRRHVLRFEVAPETFATFREATLSLRRAAGGALDDDALLLTMARQVLGAPGDGGRSGYRISYELCPACGHGGQVVEGELVAVGAEILGMAACDGEHVGLRAARPANENRSAIVGASDAAAPAPDTARVGQSPPADPTGVALDGSDSPANAQEAHAVSSAPAGVSPARAPRARQAVPPALRRAVLARDRQRCQVPGCTHTHFVDVHHVRPRSEGGRNTIENLVTLCTAHHRATHRGELIIEGGAACPTFRHADGTPYGQPVAAQPTDAHAKVFAALRHLRFPERAIHAVLAELRAERDLRNAPANVLLREALCRIRPGR